MKPLLKYYSATAALIISIWASPSWGSVTDTDPSTPTDSVVLGTNASAAANSVAIGRYATAGSTSGTAIGDGASAEGGPSVAIGANARVDGAIDTGTAIGNRALVTQGADNSVALGSGSIANRNNEVSIGGGGVLRLLSNVADGTKTHDAVNVGQLEAARNNAVAAANQHTDTEITALDGKAKDYATAAKSEAVKDANQYSDDTAQETLKSANDYTERRAVVAENNAVTRSNAYTDESSSRTLESANTYTNHRSVQAENNAVARSNAYTDNRFGELKHQVDRNEKRANGGIAGAMAMTAIPSVPGHDFSFGMATSGYRGQGAIAAGVKANITQNTTVSLNTAWDSGNGVGVAAGFSVGW
ncbi:hypothetical protein DSO52_07790 [Salmonella enterica]|nr:hypothetical protein [Salmonella enterica]